MEKLLMKHLLHHQPYHQRLHADSFSSGEGSDSPFRSNLTNKNISWLISAPIRIMTVFIQILVASSLTFGISELILQSTFCITNFQRIFINMNRGKHIFRTTFSEITIASSKLYPFPGHKCHHQVSTKGQFAIFCCIAFTKHLTFFNFITLFTIGFRLIHVPWFVF
jgi:hypothetical protein